MHRTARFRLSLGRSTFPGSGAALPDSEADTGLDSVSSIVYAGPRSYVFPIPSNEGA